MAKRRRNWWRFGLRTLLAVLTFSCLVFGRFVQSAREQKAAGERLAELGASFGHSKHAIVPKTGRARKPIPKPGPAWLVERLGIDYVAPISAIVFDDGSHPTDSDLAVLNGLTGLEVFALIRSYTTTDEYEVTDDGLKYLKRTSKLKKLILDRTAINGSGLRHLAKNKGLKVLRLRKTSVGDEGLEYVRPFCKLRHLSLGETQITDASLEIVGALTSLETLDLYNTRVTSRGVRELIPLTRLRSLDLVGTLIDDEVVAHLAKMPSLNSVRLDDCVSESAAQALRESLPTCAIGRFALSGGRALRKLALKK